MISMAAAGDAEILRARLKTEGHERNRSGAWRRPEPSGSHSSRCGFCGQRDCWRCRTRSHLRSGRAGKTVGLANKECLVAAGELITAEARRQGKPLLPIDSEHNAVHQCLRGGRMDEVERIWLTASGGPFLNTPKSEFSAITVEQALNHPTWKMGQRITIDSATLMNKGLRSDRGLPAVPLAARPGGGDCPSAVDDSFHGRVRGWQHTCSILRDRYAAADPVCADLSGAHSPRTCASRSLTCGIWISARRTWKNSLVCAWPTKRRRLGAPRRWP